jgi:hypothetical protein
MPRAVLVLMQWALSWCANLWLHGCDTCRVHVLHATSRCTVAPESDLLSPAAYPSGVISLCSAYGSRTSALPRAGQQQHHAHVHVWYAEHLQLGTFMNPRWGGHPIRLQQGPTCPPDPGINASHPGTGLQSSIGCHDQRQSHLVQARGHSRFRWAAVLAPVWHGCCPPPAPGKQKA